MSTTTTQHTQTAYKDTSIGKIPADWEVKRLGEIVSFLDENRRPIKETERSKMKGPYPYYGASGIIDYVNDYLFDDELILLGEDGANILSRATPLAFMVEGKVWVNNHAHVLKTLDGYDRKFVTEYLESIKYDKYNTGTAQPKLNKEVCLSIPIVVPPLSEQKRIAKVLSTWDKAIQLTEQLIRQKEQRKKWLMQQLLSEKRIVKNEKWCKSGVKEVFLKDVAKVTMGQSPNSEDYNTDKDGLPLIQGNADLNERKQVVRYWTSQSNKECDSGDIIMTVRAPVGAIGLATQKSSIGRGVCSIKPKNIDYWYLYHLLVYKEEQWKKLEQGSTFTAVGSKDIFHFSLFIVHSLEEQTAIAEVLQTADKEIELLKAKAEKLKEQKKGLMQMLLTGKKRLL
jgi:type I restriction enzyme S subunit